MGFPLVGAHASARCDSCHRKPPDEVELPKDCLSCHRADDVHAGRFGTACQTCHTAVAWKQERFDHDTKTKFPLREAHAKVACEGCHTKSLPKGAKLDMRCIGCHGKDDVHREAWVSPAGALPCAAAARCRSPMPSSGSWPTPRSSATAASR